MSVEKAKIKMSAVSEVGSALDDLLEKVERRIIAHQGGQVAIKNTLKGVGSVMVAIKADLKEDKFSEETAKELQKTIIRIQTCLTDVLKKEEVAEFVALGEKRAFQEGVKVAKRIHDSEERKTFVDEDAADNPGHPGPSIRHQRDEEELASDGADS